MGLTEQGRRGLERDGRVKANTCLLMYALNTHVCEFLRSPGDVVGGGCRRAKEPKQQEAVGINARGGSLRCVVEWNQIAHSGNW